MRFVNPMDGDLNGYVGGSSTLTRHLPPSYGPAKMQINRCVAGAGIFEALHGYETMYVLSFGP